MWGRKRKPEEAQHLAQAREDVRHADAVIAHIESHDKEITQIVNRLQRREQRNNFGESLIQAMRRTGEEGIRGSH